MIKGHSERGAILPFLVTTTLSLVAFGVFLFSLMVWLGGSRQGTNANDAGNLNVAKCAPLISVPGNSLFSAVAINGGFSLRNINRVWGDTMLVELNERSMELSGTSTAASQANAAATWAAAQDISSRLAKSLNTRSKLEPFYKSVAHRNRLNMLNPPQPIQPIGQWRTSLMNRGGESNVRFFPSQLPPSITLPSLGNPVISKGSDRFWKGYTPIPGAGGRLIHFVSFESKQMPHAVSLKTFTPDTQKKNPLQWSFPVPNAFESVGQVTDDLERKHEFDAVALCNTEDKIQPQIPGGFVRITLLQDRAKWMPYGMPGTPAFKLAPKYRTTINEYHIIDPLMWGSWWQTQLDYGHQYNEPGGTTTSLYMALYGMTRTPAQPHLDPMYAPLNSLLLQRVNEIKPGTTMSQICELLHSRQSIQTGDQFFIALNGAGSLAIGAGPLNQHMDLSATADGRFFPIQNELPNSTNRLTGLWHYIPNPPPLPPFPCAGIPKPHGVTYWTHTLKVTPGTGGNGALLDITQQDETRSIFTGT